MGNNSLDPLAREIEYNGYLIVMTEEYRFEVKHDPEDWPRQESETFVALFQAKDAIDAWIKKKTTVKKITQSYSIPALNEVGENVILKGFHAGRHNEFLVSPKQPEENKHYYANAPAVQELLQRRAALRQEERRITKALERFYLSPWNITHGRKTLEEKAEALKAEAEGKARLATIQPPALPTR